MNLDRNELCPCGSEKKIKFCCCADIASELQKLGKMIEGEQFQASLERVGRLLAKHPDRPALLSLKAILEMETGELDAASATASQLAQTQPGNATAHAQLAIAAAAKADHQTAIDEFQRALELCGESMPETVYQALGIVGEALLIEGLLIAGRAHLMFQAALGVEQNTRPFEWIMRVNQSPDTSLLQKQHYRLSQAPPEAPWRPEFDEALAFASRGGWAAGLSRFEALASHTDGRPPILRNLAILKTFLGEGEPAKNAWQAYAALEGVAHDDAVEAEALAFLFGLDSDEADTVDEMLITHPVQNVEELMERLRLDRRAHSLDINALGELPAEEVRPKALYQLLDRPMPESAEGLERADLPRSIAQLALYGKQTDRHAQLRVFTVRTEDFDDKIAVVKDACGGLIGDALESKKVGARSAAAEAMSVNWVLPAGMSRERARQLQDEQSREIVMQRWPDQRSPSLGGRTPREVLADEAGRRKVEALILLMEERAGQRMSQFDYNELRASLGLPRKEEIELGEGRVGDLPPIRLRWLAPEKLSDEALAEACMTAYSLHDVPGSRRLASEVVRRGGLGEQMSVGAAHEMLIDFSISFAEAIEHFEKASEAEGQGRSDPGRLLRKLDLLLRWSQLDAAVALIRQITSQYGRHDAMMQQLGMILASHGIHPQQMSRAARPPAAQPPAPAGSGLILGNEPSPAPAPAAAEESAGGKGKLWLPPGA